MDKLPVETVRKGVEASRARLAEAESRVRGETKAIREFQDACPHPKEEVEMFAGICHCKVCGKQGPRAWFQ